MFLIAKEKFWEKKNLKDGPAQNILVILQAVALFLTRRRPWLMSVVDSKGNVKSPESLTIGIFR